MPLPSLSLSLFLSFSLRVCRINALSEEEYTRLAAEQKAKDEESKQ